MVGHQLLDFGYRAKINMYITLGPFCSSTDYCSISTSLFNQPALVFRNLDTFIELIDKLVKATVG